MTGQAEIGPAFSKSGPVVRSVHVMAEAAVSVLHGLMNGRATVKDFQIMAG